MATIAAGRKNDSFYDQCQRNRELRQCKHRGAIDLHGRTENRPARRLLRPLSAQRTSRLHVQGDAFWRAFRFETSGDDRTASARARRGEELVNCRRRAVLILRYGFSGLLARNAPRKCVFHLLDGSGWPSAAVARARKLLQHPLFSRRPPPVNGYSRSAIGYLGL